MSNLSPRRTRLQRKKLVPNPGPSTTDPIDLLTDSPVGSSLAANKANASSAITITTLPARLTTTITGLSRADHTLLLQKQSLLLQTTPLSIPSSSSLKGFPSFSLSATLLFAQPEAGTAVCIHPTGTLLTCAHCIAETPLDVDYAKTHWLVFASGRVVGARCIVWDGKRDLALLRVISISRRATSSTSSPPLHVKKGKREREEEKEGEEGDDVFPAVEVAEFLPKKGAGLVCVGHPGSEDLEAPKPGQATGYDVLHVSLGKYRGCAAGQDVQDNEEIGALMHDCWTYWGHSGAPLLDAATGRLVGLHSSWDDETGMRRGVSLEAIRAFLEEKWL